MWDRFLYSAYRDATSALNDYLKSSSQDKTALELKVKILLRTHRYNYAKQVAKTLLMLGGEESQYLYYYGFALLCSGDFEGAYSTFHRAYSLDPDGSFSFGSLARQAKELNNLKKKGNDLVSQGKADEAIAEYTKVQFFLFRRKSVTCRVSSFATPKNCSAATSF